MKKRITRLLLLIGLVSCSPTSWLKLDVLNPAELTFPDTGKISVLNASYLPAVISSKTNLISQIPLNEQFIIDTLIINNLFNGFFSVTNESPFINIRNAEYEEIRTNDTTNFLGPLSSNGITHLCKSLDSRFLISFEYYSFFRRESKESLNEDGWQFNLEVPYQLVWRIYRNDGILLDQFIDSDTLYWYENIYTYHLPELPDALREVFFLAGEKYAKRVSPYWSAIKREYFLLSRNGNDISLDRDQLLILKTSKRRNLAYRACYNLAVLSESEDNLMEAIKWLDEANSIMLSDGANFYRKKLEKRSILIQKIESQSGKI